MEEVKPQVTEGFTLKGGKTGLDGYEEYKNLKTEIREMDDIDDPNAAIGRRHIDKLSKEMWEMADFIIDTYMLRFPEGFKQFQDEMERRRTFSDKHGVSESQTAEEKNMEMRIDLLFPIIPNEVDVIIDGQVVGKRKVNEDLVAPLRLLFRQNGAMKDFPLAQDDNAEDIAFIKEFHRRYGHLFGLARVL